MRKILIGISTIAASLLFIGVASAATVIVTPSNMQGWAFVNDVTEGAGTGMVVAGPATPPLGTGSAQLTTTSITDGQILAVATSTYANVPLSALTTLSYSTYQSASNPSNATAIALQFDVEQDVTAATQSYQGRIVYEPYNNSGGTVPLGSWNTWDALNSGNGMWWLSHSASQFGGNCPQAAPCTLTQLETLYPHIGIYKDGAVVLKAGSGWSSFNGNVDNLTIGISGNNTTYDFDPDNVTTDPATPVGITTATVNGTDGPTNADNTSFWWGTTPIVGTLTPGSNPGATEFPASGWTHDGGLGSVSANAPFDEPLTGLSQNTEYYFVAWVLIDGTWYPGQVLNFTTGTAPTPTVVTNSATQETPTTAIVNGTDGSVSADEVSFWWGTTAPTSPITTPGVDPASTSEFPAGWTHDPGLAGVSAGGSFSESLTGLTPGATYYYLAWVQSGGIWYPGNLLTFVAPMTAVSCPTGLIPSTSPISTLSVNSNSDSPVSSATLANGKSYLIVSSGTWQNTSTNAADTEFASVDSWAHYQEGYDTNPYFLGPNEFQLQVNGGFVNWGPYDGTNHTYSYLYTGTGSPASFMVFDGDSRTNTPNASWYGDNTGSLSVSIYQCVVPPPPANACSLTSAPTGYTLRTGTSRNDTVTLAPNTMYVDKSGNNYITGPAGNYIICTGDGNDTITLGDGADTINDAGGNNVITLGNGSGWVSTGDGNDTITTGPGNFSIVDTGGNNWIKTGNGNETITTGSGNDTITTGNGTSVINGGGGNNVVKTGTGFQTITTGSGNDTITTQSTGNTINAGSGHNSVTQL